MVGRPIIGTGICGEPGIQRRGSTLTRIKWEYPLQTIAILLFAMRTNTRDGFLLRVKIVRYQLKTVGAGDAKN